MRQQKSERVGLGRNMRTRDEEIARDEVKADFASKIEVVHELRKCMDGEGVNMNLMQWVGIKRMGVGTNSV